MAKPTPIITAPETSGACIAGNNRPIMAAPATNMTTPYTIIRNPSLRRLGVLRDPIIWTVLPRMTPPRRRSRIAPTYAPVTPIPSEDAIGPVARINRPTPRSRAPPTIPRAMEMVLGVRRDGEVGDSIGSTPQRFPEERQAHVVPVVDVGVGVLELLVDVSDVPVEELPVQGPCAPDQVELVLRPAVDVHEPQPTEARTIPIHHVHRIPRAPTPPDLGSPFPGLDVEREVDPHLLAPRVRRVVRRHPDRVQDGVHLFPPSVRLPPVPSQPLGGAAVTPERGEGFREVHDVAEFEQGISRVIRQRGPGVRMQHPLDDGAVAPGRLPPDPPTRDLALRFDEGDQLLPQVVVVSARPARVDVLVPADPGEAVDERDDHRAHLPRPDDAVELRLQVLAQPGDTEEQPARPRVSA